jgi:hypothetical protein
MKRLTAKERIAKYALGGEEPVPGPSTLPTPVALPTAFEPFSQEYALPEATIAKAKAKKIKLIDDRKFNPATNKPYSKDKIGGKTLEVDPDIISTIVAHAKAKGIDPYDALAVPYQETGFGATSTGLGEVKDYYPDQEVSDSFLNLEERKLNEEANAMVKGVGDKFKYAKSLGFDKKGKDYIYQAYNGYGKIGPKKGEKSTSYYGIPVTKENPLDMSKNPAYGKTVLSLRKVLENNPEIKDIINKTEAFKPYSKFAEGGQAGGAIGEMLPGMLPQLGNALMAIFDKPQYTNQPIMNAQTAKNMTSPYAFGGELDDIDDEQFKMYLQAMFNNQLDAEEEDDEDGDTLNEGIDEDIEEEGGSEFAMGGKANGKKKIYIKPSKKGTFTAAAKKHGSSVQGFASKVLANKGNYSTAMVKKANFAKNASKWHGMGGDTYAAMGYYAQGGNTNIEVEDDEVLQTPDGQMQQMSGPTHEEGGIDVTVPKGTKIYSDRLELEGKSMQQRKMSREKRLAKATKTFEASPSDAIARNTLERTKEVVMREEQQDMALQKIAQKIYAKPQQGKQAAYGDDGFDGGDPWNDYMMSQLPGYNTQIPFMPGADTGGVPNSGRPLSASATGRSVGVNVPVTGQTAASPMFRPSAKKMARAEAEVAGDPMDGNASALSTGDYIGLGANLFNAIAPIINTRNAAKATKPEVNRFQSFGKQAMEANAKAQSFAGVQASNAKRELDTAAGTATLRNRLGARSVNTMRALDTVTDINRNKAIGSVNAGYTSQMTGLLGQEAQLANQRDQVVMSGATARDEREAQNTDNYYSNMAENLTNFGSNIGNIGKNLNQSRSNKDNVALLESMSEYFDFGRDKSGKLVIKNKAK